MQRLRVLAAEDDVRDITRHLTPRHNDRSMPNHAQDVDDRLTPGERPQKICLEGRMVVLEPLDPAKHTPALWEAVRNSKDGLWRFVFDRSISG